MLEEIDQVLASPDPAARTHAVRQMLEGWSDGRIKMCLTAAGLRLRRAHPETFLSGDYVPLHADVSVAAGAVAFARVPADGPAVIAVAPRLVAPLMGEELTWPLGQAWQTSRVLLPDALKSRRFQDVVTGRMVAVTSAADASWIFIGEALSACPAALLVER
jgi:(1->4)-alpha-D-glucan 1-alpha-D-glucosylmutase